MFCETVEYPRATPAAHFLFVLGAMAAVVALVCVLGQAAQTPLVGYASFVLVIPICWYLVNERMAVYRYTLDEDEFFIDRVVGSRVSRLMTARVSHIAAVGHQSALRLDRATRPQLCGLRALKARNVAMLVDDGGKRSCILFQPSDRLRHMLEDAVAKRAG